MRALVPCLFLGCWLTNVPLQAAEAVDWLDRLAAAEQQQSYQGSFIYERNGSFSTHGIWHAVGVDGLRERVLQLDGPAQELLLSNGRVVCQSVSAGEPLATAPHSEPARGTSKQLNAVYDLQVLGPSRIAGRAAIALALLPRDQYRYGMELHIDAETGLLLKSLLLSEHGQLLERFQFVGLQPLAQLDERALQPVTDCKPALAVVAEPPIATTLQPAWLPPGFAQSGMQVSRNASTSELVQTLLFNDGLAHFSVFIEPLAGAVIEEIRSQLGPTSVVSRRVADGESVVMVTVVGEIPLATAEQVALSIAAAPAAPAAESAP